MHRVHNSIRKRETVSKSGPRADAKQRIALSKAEVLAAEAHYLSGATLREAAAPLGISHARLASMLRERGHKIRRSAPSEADIDQMVYRYETGESLATIGKKLGFQANTVRTHLLRRGIATRDTHGRNR